MWYRAMKRSIDIVGAMTLLVLLGPVILACLVMSAVVFGAWPLFIQPRLGRDGEVFSCPKIRSLPTGTPSAVSKYELVDLKIPRWGRFIRSIHADELPQLAVVVAGKMSLIGPRPEMPELAATFDEGFVKERALVRPGVTGLWQVSHGGIGLIGDAPEYDRFYIEQRTARLDAWIMWRTVLRVLHVGAPIGLMDVPRWCAGIVCEPEVARGSVCQADVDSTALAARSPTPFAGEWELPLGPAEIAAYER